jgi:hypothetical protein
MNNGILRHRVQAEEKPLCVPLGVDIILKYEIVLVGPAFEGSEEVATLEMRFKKTLRVLKILNDHSSLLKRPLVVLWLDKLVSHI